LSADLRGLTDPVQDENSPNGGGRNELGRTESPGRETARTAGAHRATYTIFEGTSEIQRLVISRAITGMRIE
jgi:hypothetical protein